jgi:Cys-tRNA(Pro)/Cys-tRNA(Cys) deacylase
MAHCLRPAKNLRQAVGAMKTNAVRTLEKLSIAYELRDYEVDEADLAAETVAQKVGLPAAQVFKTLVVRGDKTGVMFAVVAADAELDLKKLAELAGDRRAEAVPLKEVQPLTGYIRGGVTALAAKKDYPVFLDQSALSFDRIAVSAGVRGTQIVIDPRGYQKATRAKTGSIARAKR